MFLKTISSRLIAILLTAVTGVAVVSALSLFAERDSLLEDKKVKTRHLVESASSVAAYFHARQQKGEMAEVDAKAAALGVLKTLRYEKSEYFWVHDLGKPVPKMVMHPASPALDGKVLDDQKFNKATLMQAGTTGQPQPLDNRNLFVAFNDVIERAGDGFVTYMWPKPVAGGVTSELYPKLSYVRKFEPWGWVIGSGIYIDDVDEAFRHRALSLFGVDLLIVAAISGVLFFLMRGISRPIRDIRDAMTSIQQTRDLSRRVKVDSDNEISEIARAFNGMVESFHDLIRNVTASSQEVTTLAARLSRSASQVAQASSEQRSAAASMAADLEETQVSIQQVASSSDDTHQVAEEAGRLSQQGETIVAGAATEMALIATAVQESAQIIEELGRHSNNISSVVNVIKEIADQTNLLALNAAIEAARAGEQGRGFAVVADEVRKLAERTTASTHEITTMIEHIQTGTVNAVRSMHEGSSRVSGGVMLAREAGQSMTHIREGAERVIGAIDEITAALHEESSATQDVVKNVERIVAMSDSNSTETAEIAMTAENLEMLSKRLLELVNRFRT